jgi:hypothetical protein
MRHALAVGQALALCLALSAAPARGADWEPFAETSAGGHSLDRASLHAEGGETKAWVRTDYSPAAARARGVEDRRLRRVSYSLVLYGVDCRKRTVRVGFEGDYDKKGNLLGRIETDSGPGEIPPGSLAELLAEQVCSAPAKKVQPPQGGMKRGVPGRSTKPDGAGRQ